MSKSEEPFFKIFIPCPAVSDERLSENLFQLNRRGNPPAFTQKARCQLAQNPHITQYKKAPTFGVSCESSELIDSKRVLEGNEIQISSPKVYSSNRQPNKPK
jgi:hypothetical protein